MTIKNESKINDRDVLEARAAIEHRATWFYLLFDEARKDGLDWDSFARRAITRCGCFHGAKFSGVKSLEEFSGAFITDSVKKIFEAEIKEVTHETLAIEFHYCPLVAAWQKQTDDEKDIARLCDIAMDGDRGIVSTLKDHRLDLQSTIASGANVCRIIIEKKR